MKEKYSKRSENGDRWDSAEPCIIVNLPKSERWPHPLLGVVRRASIYSNNLTLFCNQRGMRNNPPPAPDIGIVRQISETGQPLHPGLTSAVKRLCPRLTTWDQSAYVEYSAASSWDKLSRQSPVFKELQQFVINLSSFLNGCYSERSVCLEPFQKQLILHTLYFIISIKAPESTNRLFQEFKDYFGLFHISEVKLQTYKQKASVFLIPRRHGKTWIVVAILSIILMSVENISLGYVAHQKHVANSVFSEIINILYRWCGKGDIDVKKESGTITFARPGRMKSTLLCATCFNKNVSKVSSEFGKNISVASSIGLNVPTWSTDSHYTRSHRPPRSGRT